jgi:glucose/arabinose dehydrogenase
MRFAISAPRTIRVAPGPAFPAVFFPAVCLVFLAVAGLASAAPASSLTPDSRADLSADLSANISAVPLAEPEALPLDKPIWFGEMPGRPGTFVVLELKVGRVSLLELSEGKWIKTLFLELKVQQQGEMGLLGIAFHPDFPSNRKYYLNWNPPSGAFATHIDEFEADSSFARDSGKPPRRILRIEQTKNLIHKGGTLAFGPKDGFLYVGMGDGGEGRLAQDRGSLLGKFLRVDVNVTAPDSFRVPEDNPFVGRAGARPEIWALGLRNPWKWSFDPVTGTLWAGDVGEVGREEIDTAGRGSNLGWPWREGSVCLVKDSCDNPGLTAPVADYGRENGNAVVGGTVFRGNPDSPLYGAYFFSDYGKGALWFIQPASDGKHTPQKALNLPFEPVSFGTDARGGLYLVRYDPGMIYRLESAELARIMAMGGSAKGLPPWLRARRGQVFRAFGKDGPDSGDRLGRLDFHTLEGRKVLTLTSGKPEAILELEPGIYLLRRSRQGQVQRLRVE